MKRTAKYLKMAFRNLGRHRIKTVLTALAIVVGITLFIWMDAFLLGADLDSRRNLVNYETGAAKIYSNEYYQKKDELPLYESFTDYEKIISDLENNGYYTAPHAVFVGSLKSQNQELPFKMIGIDPEKEKNVFKYHLFTEPPHRFEKNIFQNFIMPNIKNSQDKVFILNSFVLNESDGYYYIKNSKNNKKLQNLNNRIDSINNQIKNTRIDSNLSALQEKLKKLQSDKYQMEKLRQRAFLDKLKNIFKKIPYYNFVENGKREILIGVKGAKDLNVEIGDDVKLFTIIDKKDDYGNIRHIHQAIDLKIAGIVNSPNPKTNGYIAYLPLDILQDENGILLEGHITEISIRKKGIPDFSLSVKEESPYYIKQSLDNELPDNLVLVSWEEDAKDYLAISSSKRIGNTILLSLLFLIAFIGIANTMLMAVFERTKEIGMMRAIGMRDRDIIYLFLVESGLIGFIGSILGVTIGIILNYYMVTYGIDYTFIMEKMNVRDFGYRVVGIFRAAWNWPTIILSGIITTIIASICSYLPAKKAIKMSIVDTLRFE